MKKFIRAAKEYSGVTLEFRTPDLEVAELVTDKAWKIGGFGSTGSETSNATVDVPASQDVSKIEELIDFAQDNGAFLNLQSARKLESFGFEFGDIDAACGRKSVKSSCRPAPKRAIKAFEYDYDEEDEDARYEAEYATIEYATEGVDELSAWVDALKAGIEEYKEEYEPWGGTTSDWEMFGGPDDAEAFGEQVREIKDEIINLSRNLGDVLNVSIHPDEFYK